MKHSILALTVLALSAVGGISQTPPADADPVLQGSTTYKLPQAAIDAEIDGKVTIAIHVDKTGKPTKANVVAGPIWPCSSMPIQVLESLFSGLSETILKLQFSPAIKNGKPVEKDIGLTLTLKNPKLEPKPAEIDTSTGKPKPRMIKAGILNGKALALPKPEYPASARAGRVGGSVPVQVLVDEKGNVIRAGAIGGEPLLQFPSRASACGAKFAPTLLERNPIKFEGIITYNFVPHY